MYAKLIPAVDIILFCAVPEIVHCVFVFNKNVITNLLSLLFLQVTKPTHDFFFVLGTWATDVSTPDCISP